MELPAYWAHGNGRQKLLFLLLSVSESVSVLRSVGQVVHVDWRSSFMNPSTPFQRSNGSSTVYQIQSHDSQLPLNLGVAVVCRLTASLACGFLLLHSWLLQER